MARKYSDPIMKGLNNKTNGIKEKAEEAAEKLKASYIPSDISNGIDFTDLSDFLKNLLSSINGGLQFDTSGDSYNFTFGDNDVSALIRRLSSINAGGSGGSGGGLEYLASTSTYDWFRMPLVNSIATSDSSGGVAGQTYYMHLLFYQVTLDAATQSIIVYDADDNTIFSYETKLPAQRPAHLYVAYGDNNVSESTTSGDSVVSVDEYHSRYAHIPRERTAITPSQTALTLPSMLSSPVRDRCILTGATSDLTGTTIYENATIEDTSTTTTLGVFHSYAVTDTEDIDMTYSLADSPLTHIQISNGVAYNYAPREMTATIMRMIINEDE